MQEIWKDIEGYEGYQVSNLGRVKSLERITFSGVNYSTKKIQPEKIKAQNINNRGYYYVTIKKKKLFVHRLVAIAFIDNPFNKPCVDHINTDKSDNTVDNLRWVNSKENQNNNLTRKHMSEKHVFTDNMRKAGVKNLKKAYEKNKVKVKCITTGEIFNSIKEACNKYNLLSGNLSGCCKGKRNYCGKLNDGTKLEWCYYEDNTEVND